MQNSITRDVSGSRITLDTDRQIDKPVPTSKQKKSTPFRRLMRFLLVLGLVILLPPFTIMCFVNYTNESRIYQTIQQTPARPVGIVFGAGLNRDGSPSPMLADRMASAVALYKAGKVERLLLTGDDTTSREVTAMRKYALKQGVPASAIISDQAGLRTYDSCYRAAHNFGITSATLVTQGYHLSRALYLCNALGIDSIGIKSGLDYYPGQMTYDSREFMAVFLSWVDITFIQPRPEIEQHN